MPWDLLAEAARRRAVVVVVLNRVEPAARAAVGAHLGRMLGEHGLDAHVVVVPESPVHDGLLPAGAVGELGGWLRGLVGDASTRDAVVQRTVRGAVADLVTGAPRLAAAVDAQRHHADRLRATVDAAYSAAGRDVAAATEDGTLLRGEVLARWQEYVGTGELLRAVEERVGTWRDRLTAALRGRPTPEPVARAVGDGLIHLVVDAADAAAERAHAAWYADPAGRELLAGLRLSRASGDLAARVDAEVAAWQAGVLELVSTEGAERRTTARVLSFGVNGLGAALMVAVFAHTGGLTTAEVGVAGGTAVVAQRLLEAVFGDDAVRRLTTVAHDDLSRRVGALLDAEAARFRAPLEAADVRADAADRIRNAVAALTLVAVEPRRGAPAARAPVGPGAGVRGARRARRDSETVVAVAQGGPVNDPTQRFSDRVETYVRARPGYPDGVVRVLRERAGLEPGTVVADVGAGTGIFTRVLLAAGAVVLAIEPNAPMRERLRQDLGGDDRLRVRDGRAEATGLPDASIDLVTAAQAFHWFDRKAAALELPTGPAARRRGRAHLERAAHGRTVHGRVRGVPAALGHRPA